ncbi:uncharacterized protein [Procambarus clarkii]|uniref:uncharacterized protein n=1 Tax=Procambarus clarkii TaxID=6728 RepID=UPI003742260C
MSHSPPNNEISESAVVKESVTTLIHISKAFLTVGLQEEDRNFTKFLWVTDPLDPYSDVITCRSASVLFGATSSPFLLQATLDLKKSKSPYKAKISINLYVDNFQGTTNNEIKLVEIYYELNCELLGVNMLLQSWASNNKQLNQIIEKEFQSYQVPNQLKVLGMEWNTITDEMNVKRSLPQLELTALVVGVRLAHCLTKTLNNIYFGEIVVWSDNEAVLQRLIQAQMWLNGPPWLISGQWPKQKPQVIVTNITTPTVDPEPPRTLAINPHDYSNLSKQLRVTAHVFDYLSKIGITHRFPSPIKYWIKRAQQETYGSEYENLPNKLTKSLCIWRYDARVCPYPGPPPLPKERVVHLRPFETTGVDYTGALMLTGSPDKIPVKACICLFTCATAGGIHLEVTSDMSAEAFIQAFRRFAARRSCPKLMISDNGSNFVAGEACLREVWNHPEREPLSPSHGGLLSPQISLADEDPADPSHVTSRDLVESYHYLSRVIEKRNDVWTREYLTALREYHYRASSPYNKVQLKPGDLVLVDSDGPRSEWPIGKIVSVHPDRQGILRIVKVLCRGTTTLTEHKCSTEPISPPVSEDSDSVPQNTRPLGAAAQQCNRKLQQFFSSD